MSKVKETLDSKGAVIERIRYNQDETTGGEVVWETYEQYHENGNIHYHNYRKEDGGMVHNTFFENGKKYETLPFNKEGKLHGEVTRWHVNGKVAFKESYKDGKQHGFSQHFDYKGNLCARSEYDNGVPVGVIETYDDFGNRYLHQYKEGKLVLNASYSETLAIFKARQASR